MTVLFTAMSAIWPAAAATVAAGLVGCAGSEPTGPFGKGDAAVGLDSGYKNTGGAPGWDAGNDTPAIDSAAPADADSEASVPWNPEQADEDEFYSSPVATGRYVWVANAASGRVAYVDSTTVTVHTAEAGAEPSRLAAVPGADAVLVLNAGSHDANLLRVDADAIRSRTIAGMPEHANTWAVSANGRWAVAYTDVRRVPDLANASPLEGFQEVAVIDLAAESLVARSFAVGYRPRQVAFADSLSNAYVVTEDGVSVIALPISSSRPVARTVYLEVVPGEPAARREVLITRDGGWALARSEGSPRVLFVNLATGERTVFELSGPVSDLDLNATSERALAVVKSTSEVAIFPVPGAVSSPSSVVRMTLPEAHVGQAVLAEANPDVAVLFTRPEVGALAPELTELRLTAALYRTVKLAAHVESVMLTPDGSYALAIHRQIISQNGGSRPLYGFSVVPLDPTLRPSSHETDAPITSVAFGVAGGAGSEGSYESPAAVRALLTVADPVRRVYGAYLARFAAGTASRTTLASPPIQIGTVAGGRTAYVVQQHSEGRITLVSFDDERTHTLTGFELASAILDGNP